MSLFAELKGRNAFRVGPAYVVLTWLLLQVVQLRAVRGEIHDAFSAMEAAYRNRDSGLQLILGDRQIDKLRSDPRYEAMIEKMGIRVD